MKMNFALNLWMVSRLLRSEYINQLPSVEGVFMALARYIQKHGAGYNWFPVWWAGMPLQRTYQLGLPRLTAMVSTVGNLSIPAAYHATVAVTYALGAVTLWFLALTLTGNKRVTARFWPTPGVYLFLSFHIFGACHSEHDAGGRLVPGMLPVSGVSAVRRGSQHDGAHAGAAGAGAAASGADAADGLVGITGGAGDGGNPGGEDIWPSTLLLAMGIRSVCTGDGAGGFQGFAGATGRNRGGGRGIGDSIRAAIDHVDGVPRCEPVCDGSGNGRATSEEQCVFVRAAGRGADRG